MGAHNEIPVEETQARQPKHTPGPLRVAQYSTGLNIEAANGQTICFFTVDRSSEGPLADELRAKANLFAAAPELLAALERIAPLLNDIAEGIEVEGCAVREQLIEASAAIQKAKGGQ